MASSSTSEATSRQLTRSQTVANPVVMETIDSEVVPPSLSKIAPILRAANEIENEAPRVAYLCRFYAFEMAHREDPKSSGRGVRQFKTALLQRLEKDADATLKARRRKSDAREIQNFYHQYYDNYVKALDSAGEDVDRAQLAKTYHTAAVLFEVLKAVTRTENAEVDPEIIKLSKDVEKKTEHYAPYNILPLDPGGAKQAIMQFPEIKAAVKALQNIRGLPWPDNYHETRDADDKPRDADDKRRDDLLDWLQVTFGFQKDNAANQREHLILLLANVHIRQIPKPNPLSELDDRALTDVMKSLFKNYKNWCKYLKRRHNIMLPTIILEVQQRKLLYMGLYLLIWGEASNLRFMPECLCYIFHHMAYELYGMLAGNVSSVTGEKIKAAYGGDEESFLRKVVMPIYEVIAKEAKRNRGGKEKHSQWRNYDDLNEFFWSENCFNLRWPMREDHDFFNVPKEGERHPTLKGAMRIQGHKWIAKTNFVEIRSFWHLYRSFDRMWTFFILALQAMIIIAWHAPGSPTEIFFSSVFKQVLSIFITAAILKFLQAILDIVLNWRARKSMKKTQILRHILKFVIAAAWVIILPACYVHSWDNPTGLLRSLKNWVGQWKSPSLYILAVVIYLMPNFLAAILFLFPMVRRYVESSNWRIFTMLTWWQQVSMSHNSLKIWLTIPILSL